MINEFHGDLSANSKSVRVHSHFPVRRVLHHDVLMLKIVSDRSKCFLQVIGTMPVQMYKSQNVSIVLTVINSGKIKKRIYVLILKVYK